MKHVLALIALSLAGASQAAAHPPDPCSSTSPTPTGDVQLRVSIPGGRTSFREGEIIPLALSFTSLGPERYRFLDQRSDRSGRFDGDAYCLAPEARDPLADYFSTVMSLGGGLSGQRRLSAEPFIVTAELNEWRQPRPGHYRLWVVSNRVSREPAALGSRQTPEAPVLLRSNTIAFDVVAADAAGAALSLQEAVAAYQGTTGEPQKEAARRLRFLGTKDSTDALARLFWSLREQPAGVDLMLGIFASPHRAEAIAAMQRAVGDPGHPITQDFLTVLANLQVAGEAPGDPETFAGGSQAWLESFEKMAAHRRQAEKAALAATAAALPEKTGQARVLTLVTIATGKSALVDPETAARVRRELVTDWTSLPEKTRADLMRAGVPALTGTDALPLLREIAAQPPPHFGNAGGFACYGLPEPQCSVVTSRNEALRRIFDIDPAEGRSLLLRDLGDPEAQPPLFLVRLVPPAQLRPFVQRAVERITRARGTELPGSLVVPGGARTWDYLFVAQFADKSALPALQANFKDENASLGPGACAVYRVPMLRYFLRVAPGVGAREVQAQFATGKVSGCYPTLLEDLGPYLPAVEPLAIAELDDPDPQLASGAARALGRWGTAKAAPALWTRLARFHKEWPSGVGEVPLTDSTRAKLQALDSLERTLMYAIAGGTNWLCGPEDFTRLSGLVSSRNRSDLGYWSDAWEGADGPLIIDPNYWASEDGPTFRILQLPYQDLDQRQIRVKVAQWPKGSRFYFQTYTPEQMGSPVSMERQLAVLEGLREYASRSGVLIEKRPESR
jgi:hypothetical protein